MEREEIKEIIKIIKVAYPNYNPGDLKDTVDVWYMMLKDYTKEEIGIALKTYITNNTSGFAPSISHLIDNVHKMKEIGTELGEMEAWEKVRKAISNAGYHASEEFEKLPPIIKEIVGSPNMLKMWSQTNIDQLETVIQSNFIRTYRGKLSKEKEIRRMPSEAKALIEKNANIEIEERSYI